MALKIYDVDLNVTVALGEFNSAFVTSGAFIDVTGGNGITSTGSNQSVTVAGRVSGTNNGIELGNNSVTLDTNNSVEILRGGQVVGDFVGVWLFGTTTSLTNSGSLFGDFAYTATFAGAGAGTTVTNSGSMYGRVAISNSSFSNTGTFTIFNSGVIDGIDSSFAAFSALTTEKIYNKGRMDGDIQFGSGNDLYDGRGGTFVGTAFGDAGDDTFFGGNGVERFNGGLGADKFTGGLGKDVLTMGTAVGDGIDKIIFNSLTEIGDIVTDFSTADFFQFKKAAFGNLALGTLSTAAYHENTTGAAHDASDRFIFETDTSRLWYDKDGTGSAAKVLVADMSNTVNISNADIQII